MTKNRFRLRFTFWLDLLKPEKNHYSPIRSNIFKNDRSFAGTIRDGIRLICDLRQGKLDVLFELFPWVRAEFMEYIQSIQPQKSPAELDLQQQLERLEQLLSSRGISLSTRRAHANQDAHNNGGGPKPLQAKSIVCAHFR